MTQLLEKQRKYQIRQANRFFIGVDSDKILKRVLKPTSRKIADLGDFGSFWEEKYISICEAKMEAQKSVEQSVKNEVKKAKRNKKRLIYFVNGMQRSAEIGDEPKEVALITQVYDKCKKCGRNGVPLCPAHRKIVKFAMGKVYEKVLRKQKMTKLHQKRIRQARNSAQRLMKYSNLEVDFYEFTKEEILETRRSDTVNITLVNGKVRVARITMEVNTAINVLPQLDNFEWEKQ